MIDLKAYRERAGMTQEKLSEVSGVKRTTIAMIETGKNTPSVSNAKKLASALRFDWFEFYEEGGEDNSSNSEGSSFTLAN